jgi:hypothetical protein
MTRNSFTSEKDYIEPNGQTTVMRRMIMPFFAENLDHFFIARDEAIQRGEELPEQWKSLKRSGQL